MCKKNVYSSQNFSISLKQYKNRAHLLMEVYSGTISTSDFPHTLHYLEENYPTVLNTECFNEKNLPFKEEVKATEIGHLFEHLVIDELCKLKVSSGHDYAAHTGLTSWNWIKEKKGTFHITIDVAENELTLLERAMETITRLLEELFIGTNYNGQPVQLPVVAL